MKKQLLQSLLSLVVITSTIGYLSGGGNHYLSSFIGCFVVLLYINIKNFKKAGK